MLYFHNDRKQKVSWNLTQAVKVKIYNLDTLLVIKTILNPSYGLQTQHLFFHPYDKMFVCLTLFSLRDKLIYPPYTLHSPSCLSKSLTGVSRDLPLLCNLGTPTVMETLLRGTDSVTLLSKNPNLFFR